MKNGNWSDDNIIAYCGVHGVNLVGSNKLVEKVQNCMAIDYINNEYQDSKDSDVIEVYNDVQNNFMTHKENFT